MKHLSEAASSINEKKNENMEGKLLNKIYTFSFAEAHNVEEREEAKGFLTLKAQKRIFFLLSFVRGSFLFLSLLSIQ